MAPVIAAIVSVSSPKLTAFRIASLNVRALPTHHIAASREWTI